MNPWIPVIIGLVINALVVAFAFGKWAQMIKDLQSRANTRDNNNQKSEDRRENWEDRMEDKANIHAMLPECSKQFAEISRGLASLEGKVDILIRFRDK